MRLNLQFFGGRGASGDLGNGGSDASGGGTATEITRAVYEASEPGRKQALEGFIGALEDANDSDFNGIGSMMGRMAVSDDDMGPILAYYQEGGGGIVINSAFADGNSDARYDHTVNSGYHPSRGNKSGAFAVISHETGHAVTEACAVNQGMSFNDYSRSVVQRAARQVGAKKVESFASNISGYAKSSNAECLAEAFADVRCNGSKAKAESQAIYKILVKDYNRKK